MNRQFYAAAVAASLLAAAALAADTSPAGNRWLAHVRALAADALQGRETGSPGHRQAADYVAREFEKAGLKAAGTQGYMQPVPFRVVKLVPAESGLALVRGGKVEPLELGRDAVVSLRGNAAESTEAPLIFAGYGFAVPENGYDDLKGLDLHGKIVVYMAGGPEGIPGPLKSHFQSAAERFTRFVSAGAVGAVSIPTPKSMDLPWERIAPSALQPSMGLDDAALVDGAGLKVGASVNPAFADKWFAGTGHGYAELAALADAGKALPRFPLDAALRVKVKVERSRLESQNVVGVLPGSDPKLKDEFVVLSAHVDHLGMGPGGKVYPGVLDDAGGVASIIEIARSLAAGKARPRRSVLFVAVTGEEKGLLGSRWFAAHPTVPARAIVADLNLDMYLPIFPLRLVTAYGFKESDLGESLARAAAQVGVTVQDDPEPEKNHFVRSDQYSFIRYGIPALALKFGAQKGTPEERMLEEWVKARYHGPADDLKQPIDLAAVEKFDRLMLAIAEDVANRDARPSWYPASFFRRFADGAKH